MTSRNQRTTTGTTQEKLEAEIKDFTFLANMGGHVAQLDNYSFMTHVKLWRSFIILKVQTIHVCRLVTL